MSPLVALVLLVGPLAAGAAFSDFVLPKLLFQTLVLAAWVALAELRPAESRPRIGRAAFVLALTWLALSLVSLATAWLRGNPLVPSLIEAARLVPPLLVILALVERPLTEREVRIIAGAAILAPVFVLAAQVGFEKGFNPLGVPHRPELLTSTLGNTALVGQHALLSLAFLPLFWSSRRSRPDLWIGLLALVAAAFLVVRSDARSAWFGALAIALVSMVSAARGRGFVRKPHLLFAAGAVVLALGVGLAGSGLAAPLRRLASAFDADHPTNRVRLELAKASLDLVAEHPILGQGGGRFEEEIERHRRAAEWAISGVHTTVGDPHDEVLRWLVEYGSLGLLLALVAGLAVLRQISRGESIEAPWAAAARHSAGLAVLAALPIAWTWGLGREPEVLLPLAVAIGLGLASRRPREPGPSPATTAVRRLRVLAALGALLVFGSMAERDSSAEGIRRELETAKVAVVRGNGANELPSGADFARLADASRALSEVSRSPWLAAGFRHRLQRALFNVAEQGQILGVAVASRRQGDPVGSRALVPLENALRALPDLEAIRDGLQSMLGDHPNHLPTLRLLAELDRVRGFNAEAVGHLERGLELNPEAPLFRISLALIELEAHLEDQALAHTSEETSLYPRSPETALAWEMSARLEGGKGRLDRGIAIIDRWEAATGPSDSRAAVRGELCLHFGETAETVGRFGLEPAELERLREEGFFLAGGTEGEDGDRRRSALLARIGREPADSGSLEALRQEIEAEQALPGRPARDRAALDQMRSRCIARYRVLFAWEAYRNRDPAACRTHVRDAKRLNPASGDPWLIETLQAIDSGKDSAIVEVLSGWKEASPATIGAIRSVPEIQPWLSRPEVRALLDP